MTRPVAPLTGEHGRRCMWWAMCDRPASVLIPRPALGELPACTRCARRVLEADQ